MKKSTHKILFVCLGNICRSPSAEAVMNAILDERGLKTKFEIDSAGTMAYHAGENADARMQSHALKRGYRLTSISRGIDPNFDFDSFDRIIGMDEANIRDLKAMAPDVLALRKISRMTDYCTRFSQNEVPDPYYGGSAGFELVLDLLEDACNGLLEDVLKSE